MKILLAPMQGYMDDVMRDLYTQYTGFDEVVSEFVRITHTVHAKKTWQKQIPELKNKACTPSGVPCTVQLLGSDPENMALNALEAVAAGAKKIDLNFGCPAPTVNQHHGGASLLKEPQLIEDIVLCVRQRLPDHIALSAKMRLGFEDTSKALDCARAIEYGGASSMCLHARTKLEGYKPPAHWDWFERVQDVISIPLIANGDVFTLADFIRLEKTHALDGLMLGRGALMRPRLVQAIRAYLDKPTDTQEAIRDDWGTVLADIQVFFDLCQKKDGKSLYPISRLKQWLSMLKLAYPEAGLLFQAIRQLKTTDTIQVVLDEFKMRG